MRAKKEIAKQWQGMNWIRQEKRLALYLRDGMACVYCNASVEDGARLTLDHLLPRCKGGSNDAKNLVTACHTCNSARQDRLWLHFAESVAVYLGTNARMTIDHILQCVKRPIDVNAAKALIALRGGKLSAVMQENAQ